MWGAWVLRSIGAQKMEVGQGPRLANLATGLARDATDGSSERQRKDVEPCIAQVGDLVRVPRCGPSRWRRFDPGSSPSANMPQRNLLCCRVRG